MSAALTTFGSIQDAPAIAVEPQTQAEPTQATEPIAAPAEPSQSPDTPLDSVSYEINLGDDVQDEPAAPSQPQYNWKDEIKRLNRSEVLAELAIDPFAQELDQHIKNGGQPIDYLQARAIDYNKFSDEALVKDQMRKDAPNLSPSQIDLIFGRKYSTGEDATDEDKAFFAAQLSMDAHKIRQSAIEKQQKFKIPDTVIPQNFEAYTQWEQNMEAQAQNVEALRDYFGTHAATKSLNESKRVAVNLGEGVAPLNFVVDKPESINRVLTDDGTLWNRLTSNSQGEPDVAKQQLITLFAINPNKFLQDVFNYGMQMGERKRVAEGQNAQRPQAIIAPMPNNEKGVYKTSTFGGGGGR
jgi:hypothetical protein